MADAPKTGGKKVLGMSPGTAAAIGAGVLLVAVLGYKYLHHSSAAVTAGTAPIGTTAGGTIPASLSVTPGSVTAAPKTFTAWMQKAFSQAGIPGYGYATLSNDVNAWLTGQCVSANGYKALNSVLPVLGAPPNRAGTTSKITVCSTRNGTPKTTTSGKASTPIVGTYQRAPSYTPRVATNTNFVPIKTWADTLALAAKGVAVYLWTTVNNRPVKMGLTELKALEHTATTAFPQFTTYQVAATPTSASGGSGTGGTFKWTPKGQLAKFLGGGTKGVSGNGLTLNNQTIKVGNLVTDYGARTNPVTGTLRILNTFASGATKQIQQRYTAASKQWVNA